MSNLIDNLDNILFGYLTKEDLGEYKKLISDKNILEGQYKKSKIKPGSQFKYWNNFIIKIDLLITYSKSRLQRDRFLNMLFHLGNTAIARGEHGEAEKIFLSIITEVQSGTPILALEAWAYLSLSEVYSKYAYWKKSISYLKSARKIFLKEKNIKGINRCNNLMGTIEGEKGNLNKAREIFSKNFSNTSKEHDENLKGVLAINKGIINTIQGDFDTALMFYNQAQKIFENNDDLKRLAEVRHNLGMLYTQKEENKTALKEFNKSISLSLKSGNIFNLGLSYLQTAYLYTRFNNFLRANEYAGKAMEICTRLNDQLSIADIYKIKGIIERETKNYRVAENYLLTSLRRNRELQNDLNEAESNYELGVLYKRIGKEVEAKKVLLSAYKYFKKISSSNMVLKIESLLAISN